jgi:hypothetical protein
MSVFLTTLADRNACGMSKRSPHLLQRFRVGRTRWQECHISATHPFLTNLAG